MFFVSAADTIVDWRSRLLRFFPLLDSKWLLNPRPRLTLPLPVTLNLFIAARLLLILGTLFSSISFSHLLYLGVSSIAMLRPSNRGSISTLAMSWSWVTTPLSICLPNSGWVISRPRKKTDTLTR
jgi:hypothetical protein